MSGGDNACFVLPANLLKKKGKTELPARKINANQYKSC